MSDALITFKESVKYFVKFSVCHWIVGLVLGYKQSDKKYSA